jgi:hypothetical protein
MKEDSILQETRLTSKSTSSSKSEKMGAMGSSRSAAAAVIREEEGRVIIDVL